MLTCTGSKCFMEQNVLVWWKVSSPIPCKLSQSRHHLQESPPKYDPFPGRVKTNSTGYLKWPPENEHMISLVFCPCLRVFLAGHREAQASIKPELLLIPLDLVWFVLLHGWGGLSSWKNLTVMTEFYWLKAKTTIPFEWSERENTRHLCLDSQMISNKPEWLSVALWKFNWTSISKRKKDISWDGSFCMSSWLNYMKKK